MANPTLDLSNVIQITVSGTPSNLGLPNINTAALFSTETPSNYAGAAYKIYTNVNDVITDFGSASKAAAIAAAFFAQQPNPLGTGGYLTIIPLTSGGAEAIDAAIARTINTVYYFGVLVDQVIASGPFATLATYMQSVDKMFFYCSALKADFAPGGLLDLVRQASETHTRGLYYSTGVAIDSPRMAGAYAGRALSTNFAAANSTQTMHLKSLAGIVVDATVGQTDLTAAGVAGVDVYVSIAGVASLFTSGQNGFFDEIYNELWFKFALQTAGYNYLRNTSTKIPQTEAGIEGLKNEFRKICEQARSNTFIGAGTWTASQTFGDPASLIRNVADIGYYVYSTPLSQQSTADRQARKAPTIQIAIKAAGAVHSSSVIVQVNL